MVQVKLALARHASGDWGELVDDERFYDERVAKGGSLASIFKTAAGVKFHVITEAEHEQTTIMLPEEY